MKQDSYLTSSPPAAPTVARVPDDTQSQGGAEEVLWPSYPTQAMFNRLDEITERDSIGFQSFYGDTGNWAWFLGELRLAAASSVSDEHTSCEDPKGLSGEAMPARSASAETPHPSPVYTEVVERLRASAASYVAQKGNPRVELELKAAQVIEAQAAESEHLRKVIRDGLEQNRRANEAMDKAINPNGEERDFIPAARELHARIAELEKERDEARESAETLRLLVSAKDIWTDYGSGFRIHFSFEPFSDMNVVTRVMTARSFLSTEGDSHG